MTGNLIGRIVYHLHFCNRDEEKSTTIDLGQRDGDETLRAGRKRARSLPLTKQGEEAEHENGGTAKSTGFYFVRELEENSPNDEKFSVKEYQVVAHQALMQSVIDAARFRCKVTVAKYCIVDYCTIELHREGLMLWDSDSTPSSKQSSAATQYLSLKEFQAMEMQQLSSDSKRKMTDNINICGTVDSVSPIIGAVPSDPFALIEIYDETNDWTLTAVIVLKGLNALVCQAGIQPGLQIKLKNVKRQKWQVPLSLERKGIPQRLWNRAPSHVFVVSEADSMEWNCPKNVVNGHDNFLTLPMTVETLTSIQGRVVSVQYTDISGTYSGQPGGDCKTIHYVILKPFDMQTTTMKLYLTYYPLSPMLISGIRKGCILRAVNIHSIQSKVFLALLKALQLDYTCYATCLRSTMSILSPSSECKENDDVKSNGLCAMPNVVPFQFLKIRQSYFELEWISLSRKQLSACSTGDGVIERTLRKLICHDRERKMRDPFHEWFDHVCEETHGGDDFPMLCPCYNRLLGMSQEEIPFVIGLQKLYQRTMDLMISKLSDNLHAFTDRDFGVGCTASYHIQREDLSQAFGLQDAAKIYVGGFIRRMDSKGRILTVYDKLCEMTFTPLKLLTDQNSDLKVSMKKCHQNGDFALIKPSIVVMSCLYLGLHKTQSQSGNVSSERVRLPPLLTDDKKGMLGPCSIVKVGHHLFLVSFQVLYDISDVTSTTQQRHDIICNQLDSNSNHPLDPEMRRIYGRLLRQRWTVGKDKNEYTGCQIAVSLADSSGNDTVVHLPITLSVTLKIPTNVAPLQNDKWTEIQSVYGISSRVTKMAKAWQFVAETSHSPLNIGGWDECYDSKPCREITEVHVLLPSDATPTSSIVLESLDVEVVQHKCSKELGCYFSVVSQKRTTFTYMGGQFHYPGMLPRRLRRSLIFDKGSCQVLGEALVPPSIIVGPHDASLGWLYHMKRFNANTTQYTTRPFKLRNANIAKIRFCRARAECSRCFASLCRKKSFAETSFWKNPLPIPNHRHSMTGQCQLHNSHKHLACPNGCDSKYAYIKWELSAIVEDGTGSAKIYSERETTKLILGKGLDFGVVEDGAWHSEDGIYYRIGVPLSREVKLQVERDIRTASLNGKTFGKGNIGSKNISTSGIDSKATYELHRHCTLSTSSHRKMDFLCSYKIPKPNAKMADWTEITLVSSLGQGQGVIQTFDTSTKFPGIELNLVDCFQVNTSQSEVGWQMIEALKKY